MANHQKFIKYLLSFVIAFSPVLLINNANAVSLGGWSLSNPVAQGASTLYQGAKTALINGKNVAKTSTALVTPVVKDVSKVLARGVGGVALAFAVEQILGSVDWVLDPANNQIIVKDVVGGIYYVGSTNYSSAIDACRAVGNKYGYNNSWLSLGAITPNGKDMKQDCIWTNPKTGVSGSSIIGIKDTKTQDKPYPLDIFSEQVIDNANNGNTSAQDVTTTAGADVVAEAEKDATKAKPIVDQLEANAKTETDESAKGETKPKDPAKPEVGSDLSIEFPVFCGWAPTICEAAQTVIKLPTTISEYWDYIKTKTSEWESALEDFFKEKTSDKTELEIPTPVAPDIDTNINFSSACPANFTLANFSYHGTSQNWQVDFSKFCDVFGTYVKPVVIAMGAFTAALIIGGVRTNE